MNSIKNNLAKELSEIDASERELKKFAIIIGFALLVLSLLFRRYLLGLASAAIIINIVGLAAPAVLTWPYRTWMFFSIVLGFFMIRFILVVVYYCGITVTGLIVKVFGKDILSMRRKSSRLSYWVNHGPPSDPEQPY